MCENVTFIVRLLHMNYRLFVHTDRVTEDLRVYLNTSCNGAFCVQLKSYDSVLEHLKLYVAQPGVKVWIGIEYTNYALFEIITPQVLSCLLCGINHFAPRKSINA